MGRKSKLDINNKSRTYETVKFFDLKELNQAMDMLVEYTIISITKAYNDECGDYFVAWIKKEEGCEGRIR